MLKKKLAVSLKRSNPMAGSFTEEGLSAVILIVIRHLFIHSLQKYSWSNHCESGTGLATGNMMVNKTEKVHALFELIF